VKHAIEQINWVSFDDGKPNQGRIVWVYGEIVECQGLHAVLATSTRKGFKVLSEQRWFGRIVHREFYWAPYEAPEEEAPHE
jgi:hypothetical protein